LKKKALQGSRIRKGNAVGVWRGSKAETGLRLKCAKRTARKRRGNVLFAVALGEEKKIASLEKPRVGPRCSGGAGRDSVRLIKQKRKTGESKILEKSAAI